MMQMTVRHVSMLGPGNSFPALLCFVGAMIEGYEISSAGLTAKKFGAFYGLDPAHVGVAFSASTFGMFLGAVCGGWLSDRLDRKWVLTASFALFGIFTAVTAIAPNSELFIACRVLTGIGLGAGVVNLMAMAAALGPSETRAMRVTVLFSGLAFGGMSVSLLAAFLPPDFDWRLIFFIGGGAPLLLTLFFAFALPHVATAHHEARGRFSSLLSPRYAIVTICLWVLCFTTLLTLHLMINWLPTLVTGYGHSAREAALASASFSFAGGVSGALLSLGFTERRLRPLFLLCYGGLIAGVTILSLMGGALPFIFIGGLIIGFCVNGAQFLIYGLGASVYPLSMVGTGMGAATGIGRIGSMTGPLMGGVALALGAGSFGVLLSTLLPIGLALTAMIILLSKLRRVASEEAPAA